MACIDVPFCRVNLEGCVRINGIGVVEVTTCKNMKIQWKFIIKKSITVNFCIYIVINSHDPVNVLL